MPADNKMERHHVNSSALQSVGYDPELKILELEFRDNGGLWQYHSFSAANYKKFRNAESLGHYFVTKIKGKYPEKKVEPTA
jgi:hypothetical protein